MVKIATILCPVDFSEFSTKAYGYAESLAKHYGAQLLVEHVVQPLPAAYPYPYFAFSGMALPDTMAVLTREAKSQLQQFVGNLTRNGLQPQCFIKEGYPVESILSFADEKSADLIVMGTHGPRGIDRLALGSVTERVLRKAHCPVLAVRKPAHDFVAPEDAAEPVHLHKILLATDFSDHAGKALYFAFSLAMEYNAELTMLHVVEDVGTSKFLWEEEAAAANELKKWVPPDLANWSSPKTLVKVGKPYQEIVKLAQEQDTDLIILGVRGRNVLDLAIFGSTTHRVLQLAPCPVLAVHV